jgi:hypothetical protein
MRADTWVKEQLPELLVRDWRDLRIYTEHDMQSCVYFHLRKHYDRERSDDWIIRNQPGLRVPGRQRPPKPDIVTFKKTAYQDAYEFKCLLTNQDLRDADRERIREDIEGLEALREPLGLRHAYFVLMCDHQLEGSRRRETELTRYRETRDGYLTIVIANVFMKKGRVRRGYEAARNRWELYKRAQ